MNEKYPELKDRFLSTSVDTFVIVCGMFLFAGILDGFDQVPVEVKASLFLALFLGYEPFCMAFGCTLGNYFMRIRVRKEAEPGQRIHIFQALIRYIFKLLLGWISFLTIHKNPRRRAIHDLVSGSVMIKVGRASQKLNFAATTSK